MIVRHGVSAVVRLSHGATSHRAPPAAPVGGEETGGRVSNPSILFHKADMPLPFANGT
jgi:hypothetical protein